ncbi:MAG: hypothetical protein JJ926_10940 [Roseitalea sp.]|uniref:hypothetical protein n=2 Tax=Oceaniradius stylonematis TaxID=2184161 RepID=UPI000D6AD994|nr:hypothetical protein [Oceaniradius stylonematis]MBO6553348.1 hypothetical protein [Roseitalea sp.]MBO6952391.1 hypothetical protein [Rhizobiaceae bacterium]MBO6593123.1 hypothetical protein [Roseitalea sp.]MBO6600135.1 hypothetical protein [Roseitalea sp.]MBO6613968.1 hypothetical protein [Roseitalea sp.]
MRSSGCLYELDYIMQPTATEAKNNECGVLAMSIDRSNDELSGLQRQESALKNRRTNRRGEIAQAENRINQLEAMRGAAQGSANIRHPTARIVAPLTSAAVSAAIRVERDKIRRAEIAVGILDSEIKTTRQRINATKNNIDTARRRRRDLGC